VTDELLVRLEDVGDAFNVSWVEGARDLPGNPLGVEVERFGAAVALARRGEPELDFMNRICGLHPADEGRVAEIAAFYRARRIEPWIELTPTAGFDRLAARLAADGGRHVGFHVWLYGLPEARPEPPGVEIRRVGAAEVERFATIRLEGNELPPHVVEREAPTLHAWADRGELLLYVATVDGEDAAAAALMVSDGLGYLATAATLPKLRGRGVQSALIARRISDAAELGCDLVASQTEPQSQSQRNLQRAGLRVACTKAVWRLG
jgi:GNAT superfamily N-acetyltransferase